MNSLMIFENALYYRITILSFFFFLGSCLFLWRNGTDSAFFKGTKYLSAGIVFDFISVWYSSKIDLWTASLSIDLLMFADIMLKLCLLVLLSIAATKIMMGNVTCVLYLCLLGLVGAAIAFYFSIIEPNGSIILVLRSLFPAIGFSYLSAAYFTRCFRRHKSGAILGCITATFVAYSASLGMWVENMSSMQPWFIGTLGCFGFGLSFLCSLINEQADRLVLSDQKIQKYNQRIKDIIKLSPFPIVIAKLSDDSILLANDNFLKLFGLTEEKISNFKFKDFFVDIDNRRLLNSHLEKDKILKDFDILVQAPDNPMPFWLSTSANIIDYDYDVAIYAAFQEITDRKKREALLQTQATRDPLTSLYNRRYFKDEVTKRIEQKKNSAFSVLMIDADHFKNVNDTYGHKVGDKVLMALASTAEKALRENDIVARYGGEEFVVYLAQSNGTEALAVANRLRESISGIEVLSDAGESIKFTVSIGIASSQASNDLEELIKMSDDALYQAKEKGRNRCEIYSQDSTVPDRQNKKQENIHPAFSKANDIEISLLDGVKTILEDK